MVGLLRLVAAFFLIWFILSLFTRYLLPWITRLLIMRMSGRVRREQERRVFERERRRKEQIDHEGEVTIRYKPGTDKKMTRDEGEYVEYEELDD